MFSKIIKLTKVLAPFIGMFIVIGLFHYTDLIFFKYYPPVVNFAFFAVFFSSLFKEKTIIQKIALAAEPDADENVMQYTKKLTYIWSAFMFLNFLISLLSVFMSKKIWAIYNGFISYLLVGMFFAIEYVIRLRFKQKIKRTKKRALRKQIKELRSGLDIELLSKALCRKLQATTEYQNAKNIMIFYPMKNEINLLPLLEDDSKNFYLPQVCGKNLRCCPYCTGDELCVSAFGTKEPVRESCSKAQIDLVIVPALACDKNNYRLGYGGGFYDRFLRDFGSKKIVCIPKAQIVDTVYPEKHDVVMDMVISEV